MNFRKNIKRIAFSVIAFASLFCIEHWCLARNDQRKCLLEFGILSGIAIIESYQKEGR